MLRLPSVDQELLLKHFPQVSLRRRPSKQMKLTTKTSSLKRHPLNIASQTLKINTDTQLSHENKAAKTVGNNGAKKKTHSP